MVPTISTWMNCSLVCTILRWLFCKQNEDIRIASIYLSTSSDYWVAHKIRQKAGPLTVYSSLLFHSIVQIKHLLLRAAILFSNVPKGQTLGFIVVQGGIFLGYSYLKPRCLSIKVSARSGQSSEKTGNCE